MQPVGLGYIFSYNYLNVLKVSRKSEAARSPLAHVTRCRQIRGNVTGHMVGLKENVFLFWNNNVHIEVIRWILTILLAVSGVSLIAREKVVGNPIDFDPRNLCPWSWPWVLLFPAGSESAPYLGSCWTAYSRPREYSGTSGPCPGAPAPAPPRKESISWPWPKENVWRENKVNDYVVILPRFAGEGGGQSHEGRTYRPFSRTSIVKWLQGIQDTRIWDLAPAEECCLLIPTGMGREREPGSIVASMAWAGLLHECRSKITWVAGNLGGKMRTRKVHTSRQTVCSGKTATALDLPSDISCRSCA